MGSHTHPVPCHVSFQLTDDEVCGNRGKVVGGMEEEGDCRVRVRVHVCACVAEVYVCESAWVVVVVGGVTGENPL